MACLAPTMGTPASKPHGSTRSTAHAHSLPEHHCEQHPQQQRHRSDPHQLLQQRDVWPASLRSAPAKESVFVGQDPTTTTTRTGLTGFPYRMARSTDPGMGAMPSTPLPPRLFISTWARRRARASSRTSRSQNIVATHISGWGLQMAELQNDDLQLSTAVSTTWATGTATGCLQTEGNAVNWTMFNARTSGPMASTITNTVRLTGTGLNFTGVSQVSRDAIDLPVRDGDRNGKPHECIRK